MTSFQTSPIESLRSSMFIGDAQTPDFAASSPTAEAAERCAQKPTHSDLGALWAELQLRDLARRKILITSYARAIGDSGAPAHRIEARAMRVAKLCGLGGACTIIAFPLFVLVSFFDKQLIATCDTHVLRCNPSLRQYHLDLVDALADRIDNGEFDFECSRCKSSSTTGSLSSLTPAVSNYALVATSRRASIDGTAAATPTAANAFFERRAYDIISDVDPTRAQKALDEILAAPLPWRRHWLMLAGATCSFVAPLFWFGASIVDALIASALGAMVTLFGFLADDYPRVLSHVYPMAAAFVCGFVASIVGPTRCQSAISIGGVLWLIPGLSITVGVVEISTRHPVSGTSRMFTAMIDALRLGFGLALGSALATALVQHADAPDACSSELIDNYSWLVFLLCPVLSAGLSVLCQASVAQLPANVISGLCGGVVAFYVKVLLLSSSRESQTASYLPSVVGSFAVGIFAMIYAKLFGSPTVAVVNAGIFLLVPGSFGIRSFAAYDDGRVVDAMMFLFQILSLASSITAGLLAASAFSAIQIGRGHQRAGQIMSHVPVLRRMVVRVCYSNCCRVSFEQVSSRRQPTDLIVGGEAEVEEMKSHLLANKLDSIVDFNSTRDQRQKIKEAQRRASKLPDSATEANDRNEDGDVELLEAGKAGRSDESPHRCLRVRVTDMPSRKASHEQPRSPGSVIVV